ncbi:MAG: hypothetical protein HYZ42_18455 [Bacteroidetes bacterium]|nr:hypothetical protein [Bacteroidota bacterium]
MKFCLFIASLFFVNFLLAQISPKSLFPKGVVQIDYHDSVKVYEKPDVRFPDYLTYENYTYLAEHNGSKFWSQLIITCLEDSGGWYKILAYPYSTIDPNGEPTILETYRIVYMPHNKHADFILWKDYLLNKYIYKVSGNLYTDTVTKQVSVCALNACLVSQKVIGNWMEVKPPGNHDCSQFADQKCVRSFWVKWRDDKELLIKLKPF